VPPARRESAVTLQASPMSEGWFEPSQEVLPASVRRDGLSWIQRRTPSRSSKRTHGVAERRRRYAKRAAAREKLRCGRQRQKKI